MIPEIHDYMAAGLHVFGLYGVDKNGKCECGVADCKALLKHPRQSNWQHTPLWSDEQMEAFDQMGHWRTGFGVLIQGLLVIDVDARNGGVASWQRLLQHIPSLVDCGFVVNTGSGNGSQHMYYRVMPPMALVQKHPDYPGIDFKTSGYVVGAGSLHISGARYEVERGYPQDIAPAPDALVYLLRRPDTYRASIDGAHVDIGADGILELLAHIDPDADYDTWIRCGMAIHHVMLGGGLELWDQWSSRGKKYPGAHVLERHWHSFGKSPQPVGLGTLMHYAQRGGYVQPVTFVYQGSEPLAVVGNDGDIDTSGVDLLRPPGFVGEVCQWINDQCRYPREHIAVGAALSIVSNLCGMRMQDAKDGLGLNLFIFCVSGSGSGKDSVLGAVKKIYAEVGVSPAVIGWIKSAKEMLKNLYSHQASFFVIDEVHRQLQRLMPFKGKPVAAHLEESVTRLLSLYSSSSGDFVLGGDEGRELRKDIKKEIAMLQSRIDEAVSIEDEEALKQIKETYSKRLDSIKKYGLVRPFVSLLGFAEPWGFQECITYEFATGGMLARSMIFEEKETVPVGKDETSDEDFKKTPLPDQLLGRLRNMYSPGQYDMYQDKYMDEPRVEWTGPIDTIETTDEARKLLKLVNARFRKQAKEKWRPGSALEPIHLRGYEITAKVSLVLAAYTRLRTAEHVLWAFALVWRDCEQKAMKAYAKDARDNPAQKQDALRADLYSLLSDEMWMKLGDICGARRKTPKDEIKRALDSLVEAGVIMHKTQQHPANKTTVNMYMLARRH